MDYDKIMVLDQGKVAEFGRPARLLDTPGSLLLGLVNSTGLASAAHLKELAANAARDRSENCNATPTS